MIPLCWTIKSVTQIVENPTFQFYILYFSMIYFFQILKPPTLNLLLRPIAEVSFKWTDARPRKHSNQCLSCAWPCQVINKCASVRIYSCHGVWQCDWCRRFCQSALNESVVTYLIYNPFPLAHICQKHYKKHNESKTKEVLICLRRTNFKLFFNVRNFTLWPISWVLLLAGNKNDMYVFL